LSSSATRLGSGMRCSPKAAVVKNMIRAKSKKRRSANFSPPKLNLKSRSIRPRLQP
jgi:hypothetical protein